MGTVIIILYSAVVTFSASGWQSRSMKFNRPSRPPRRRARAGRVPPELTSDLRHQGRATGSVCASLCTSHSSEPAPGQTADRSAASLPREAATFRGGRHSQTACRDGTGRDRGYDRESPTGVTKRGEKITTDFYSPISRDMTWSAEGVMLALTSQITQSSVLSRPRSRVTPRLTQKDRALQKRRLEPDWHLGVCIMGSLDF